METKFCKRCATDKPIDRFCIQANGGLKAQCKDCRNKYAKDTTQWTKACLTAAATGQELPPPPPLATSSAPVGGLNDTTCPECHIGIKRQNVALHLECVHKPGGHVCGECGFEADCFGFYMAHMAAAHQVQIERPIKMKDVYMCQAHKTWSVRTIKQQFYKRPEQLEKNRARRANAPASSVVLARKTNQARDASESRANYITGNPHIKSRPTPGYEGQPLRQHQKRFQEKSVATRNMRIEWRVQNYTKVCAIWRRGHVNNRRQRNAQSREYAVDNTRLKWQQLQHGAMRRGLQFALTEEAVDRLARMPCFYCDTPAADASATGLCGVDRVDNTQGYCPANCVPCCGCCNVMKNSLALESYLSHLEKVHRHLTASYPTQAEAEALEDTVAAWTGGVNNETLRNVEFMKFVVNTRLPTSYMSNHLSRAAVRAFVENMTADQLADLPPGEFDAQSELGMAVAPEQLERTRDLMQQEAYTVFADMMDKRAAVEYVGKHEWRLQDEEVVALMYKSVCAYCGFTGNLGIDRLDSAGAYELGNVVPCCHTCNITKNVFRVERFLARVRDTVATLSLNVTKDVVRCVMSRARALGLSELVYARRHGGRSTHFGIDAGVTTSTTRSAYRVTDVALVYQFADKRTQIVYHSRECGALPVSQCRLVRVDQLPTLGDSVTACPRCVSTSPLSPDSAPALRASSIPWLEPGDRLCTGRRVVKGAMRVVNLVVTDVISGMYHTLVHAQHKSCHAVMPLELALQVNPGLRACAKCVSTNEDDDVFEGLPGCPLLTTLEECRAVADRAQENLRAYNRAQRAKSRGGGIAKAAPGDTVLCFGTADAKTYHTVVHRISGRPGEEDEACWVRVPREGLKRGAKPCSMCCLE